VIILGIIRIR